MEMLQTLGEKRVVNFLMKSQLNEKLRQKFVAEVYHGGAIVTPLKEVSLESLLHDV